MVGGLFFTSFNDGFNDGCSIRMKFQISGVSLDFDGAGGDC